MSHKITVNIHNVHAEDTHNAMELMIDKCSLSIEEVITIGTKHFNMNDSDKLMNIKALYNESGQEITDSNQLTDNEHVYLSNGQTLDDSQQELLYLSILGLDGSGKSAVTLQYIENKFVNDFPDHIEDAYRRMADVDGNKILVDILDTTEEDDFIARSIIYKYRNKDGFMFIFDIFNRKSFERIPIFYEILCEIYEDMTVPPIILVGNKLDLHSCHVHNVHEIYIIVANWCQHCELNGIPKGVVNIIVMYIEIIKRAVTVEEGVKIAKEMDAIRYMETSAKTGYNVQNVFGCLIRQIIAVRLREQSQCLDGKRKRRNCALL